MPLKGYKLRMVGELFEDREGTPFDAMSGRAVRNYSRQFLVESSHVAIGPQMACLCDDLPRPFASYVTDTDVDLFALLLKYSSKQKPNTDGLQWIVTCDYSSDLTKADPGTFGFPVDSNGNPTPGAHNSPELEVPELEWDYEEATIDQFDDLLGKPFLNSAYQPFSPTPKIPVHRPVLMLTRNEMRYDPDRAGMYAGAVNDKVFLKYPRDSILCMSPRVRCVFDKGPIPYWKVTYRLKFGYKKMIANPEDGVEFEYESFQHRELDQGYAERVRRQPSAFPFPVSGDTVQSLRPEQTFNGQRCSMETAGNRKSW